MTLVVHCHICVVGADFYSVFNYLTQACKIRLSFMWTLWLSYSRKQILSPWIQLGTWEVFIPDEHWDIEFWEPFQRSWENLSCLFWEKTSGILSLVSLTVPFCVHLPHVYACPCTALLFALLLSVPSVPYSLLLSNPIRTHPSPISLADGPWAAHLSPPTPQYLPD